MNLLVWQSDTFLVIKQRLARTTVFLRTLLTFSLAFIIRPAFCEGEGGAASFSQEVASNRGEATSQESATERPRFKKKIVPNFLRYKLCFKEMCEFMDLDKQREKFVMMSSAHGESDPECLACKPLFLALASACRKKIKKIAKSTPTPEEETAEEAEASPSSTPKEIVRIDPNTLVLDTVTRCFEPILGVEAELPEGIKAIQKLVEILRSSEGKNKLQESYFSTLAQYVEAPFEEYLRTNPSAPEGETPGSAGADKKEDVDSLFE